MKFSIKICASTWEDANYWGDYHIAVALKKYFGRHGCDTTIQIITEWYNGEDGDCDAVIHLRGLHRYTVSEKHLNIMWNISHPGMVGLDEYEEYDIVFVASEIHAAKLERIARTKVVPLLQCTDTEIFYPNAAEECKSDLLFVGNSRNIYRKIIKDLLPTSHDLHIWGTLWEQFVDKKYIRGDYFPNENLGRLYSSCKILLSDHWDDMRELGFVSNRIFDALASKAFVISDAVAGIDAAVSDAVVAYSDSGDLRAKVDYYLKNERVRLQIAEKGYELVTKHHTFENRVPTIIGLAGRLLREKGLGKRVRYGRKKKGEEVFYRKRNSVLRNPQEMDALRFAHSASVTASIIIPVWNHWTYTYRCLRAILANIGEVAYEVIIVDNGSTDKTGEMLAKAENIRVIRNQSNAGYAVACNQGAGIARGDYLVFLNNDTEPLPGWLKELVSAADADPKAGAVGGKLIYPDGRLQEAGGMAFSDGRSWNFGNGDVPDEEIYNVMCEVDYCSGACLLVRRHLFEALGGFDVRYSPAYYEDTDLCFSLRDKGYKVIYNPDVCIIHHESVTSGTDESPGFRKYLETNRQKFIEKWADELSRQDTSPWQGRVPVTACRKRLLREDLTQEDIIYLPNGEKAVRRGHSFPVRIDRSILYASFPEKEEKAAEITVEAVRRYGNEYVGVAWSGSKSSVALLHVIKQAFGGWIPIKVISFLTGEDPPEEHRFIEKLSSEWGFDLLMPGVGPSPEVREDHDAHLNPPSETLFRTAVKRLQLKALITGRRGDGPELETPSVYFYHEDNPRYVRVQPMLHFRKVDVWHYIKRYDVPLCEVGLL